MSNLDDVLLTVASLLASLEQRVAALERQEWLRLRQVKGQDVASGTTLTLGQGNYFLVTGAGTIRYMTTTGWQPGSVVMLQFGGGATVRHAVGGAPAGTVHFELAGAVNFAASAGDTLTVAYDGTAWREIARAVI